MSSAVLPTALLAAAAALLIRRVPLLLPGLLPGLPLLALARILFAATFNVLSIGLFVWALIWLR
jgi:hypothetical protein